jgi:hypothetical protein
MKRVCPHCKTEFVTDNKQKFYCSPKCSMAKGYIAHKERLKAKKEKTNGYFNFDDYKNEIIA